MPGPMQRMLGLAAFADGWLNQDQAEQDQQLEYLESIADVAGRAQNIRGAQAGERRAQTLFPGQVEQQGLQTRQLGLETQGMERTAEHQEALDDLIQKEYGLPSWEVFKTLVDAKQTDVLQRFADATLASRVPEETVKGQEAELTAKRRTSEQFLQGPGPEAEANLRRDTALLGQEKTQYEQQVIQLRKTAGMPRIMVDTEKILLELAPLSKKVDIFSAYAQAKRALGQAANTPAGKEQALRNTFARVGLDYDTYVVRAFLIEKGEMETFETLSDNIFKAEQAVANILAQEGNMDTSQQILNLWLKENATGAESVASSLSQKPTDIKDIVAPLNKYISANKALMWEYHDRSYDKLAERKLQFTEGDLSEVIGNMLQDFPGFSDKNSVDIRNVLVNLINNRDPMQWNTWMTRREAGLFQRWGREDYLAARQILDTVQWRMGQEEDPDLVRPPAPYLGFPKKMITPLGALQKQERQERIEALGTGGVDTFLDDVMGEAQDQLQLDSLEAELQRMFGQ